MPSDRTGPGITVEGHIERVTYHHPESHFTIARFHIARHKSRITVLGYLPNPQPGESLRIGGQWEDHPRYGQQLRIDSVESMLPATVEGVKAALSCNVIRGVGAKTINRLVEHFQEKTLVVITTRPDRLVEAKGIGPQPASRLAAAWKAHSSLRHLMQYLYDNGVNPAYGARLFKEYGENTIEVLRQDPMRPAHDIAGIGFIVSDRILQNLGTPPDDPARVQACVLHVLEQRADSGNIYCPLDESAPARSEKP